MATYFRTAIYKNIGTTPADVLQTSTNNRFTLVGCNLANITDDQVIVSIYVVNPSNDQAYYIRDLIIEPYTSAKVVTNSEKIILAEQYKLRIVSNVDNSVDAVMSYAEII
jgi:hypothetical protein